MPVLLKANQPDIRPRCETTTSRMSASAAVERDGQGRLTAWRGKRDGQKRLTAEPLQRQEGCEDEGFIPERFALSFEVAVVATHLLEPG